jgi:hypothetical protein
VSDPTARAVTAGGAAAAAIAVAWLVPAAAPVLVWPLLLFLPGWAVLAFLRPRIDLAGRLGLAVVGSVALSTHLVFWISHVVGGYGRPAILLAAALLAIPVVAAAAQRRIGLGPRVRPLRWTSGVMIVAVAAAGFVGVTLAIGLWRETPTGIVSGGSNWSDLGVHLSIAETLNAGANFPPEVPYFAGEPLVYHWFADFHAAILAEAAGMFSVPAMVVQSAILSGALALLVGSLARRLVVDRRSRVATLAAILVVFGGGLGYVRLIGDLTAGLGSPTELVARNSYDNQWLTDWPYFRIPSVMGTGLLAHRATTAGLPILVGAVLLLVAALPPRRALARGWRDRPTLLVAAGTLGALLAPFHFFFLPLVPLLALAWVVAGGRLADPATPRNATLFLAPFLLAVPFALGPALQSAGSGSLRLVAGWPSAPQEDGVAAVAFFYLTNLGVPFVLALAALVGRLAHRWFLATWVVGLFIVPNVVAVSVVDFDMNKVFQAMWVAVAVLAAWLMRRWSGAAVGLVLALSIPSPLLVAGWTATSELQVISGADAEAATWVAEHTPPDAVFVTDGWVNSLTDSAGRLRLTTFGPYIANLGYDPDARIADVTTIYCGGDAAASAVLMRWYGATYLVDGGRPQPCEQPVDFATSPAFELVYGEGPLIWRLADP